MRPIRFPIAGLMVAVLVIALGLAALRNGSDIWAGVTFLMTCGVLCLAIVGVACRRDTERAWWLGFALFGWGYLLLSMHTTVELPTMVLLEEIAAWLGVKPRFISDLGHGVVSVGFLAGPFGDGSGAANEPLREIAQCLWALAAALLGGLLANTMFGGPRERARISAIPDEPEVRSSRRWMRWQVIIALPASALVLSLWFFGSKPGLGFWVGTTLLTTCGLLGLTILGVAGDRGTRQQIWLGAAVFGIGYMAMAFGRSLDGEAWPTLPTDYLLRAVCPATAPIVAGFPRDSEGVAATNARIWTALQQPVPIRFSHDTPLEQVVKFISAATRGPDGKSVAVYVDPIGLQQAEKSMTSIVRNLDFDEVPLKTSLRLCLDQLELTYRVRGGFLMITSKDRAVGPPYEEPLLIVGHCLVAMLAAIAGGIVAPLFCARPIEHAAL